MAGGVVAEPLCAQPGQPPEQISAIRIIGEVTGAHLETLRAADAIAREELTTAGMDRDVCALHSNHPEALLTSDPASATSP